LPQTRSWYDIQNAAADQADIYLFDEIGYWGVTAKEFVNDLQGVSAPLINLFVNSPGGEVFDGVAIYNALKNHAATVHAFIEGIAASSASFIVQAAEKIVMRKSATMMIHEPHGMAYGDASTMTRMAETLDHVAETIAGIYAERAGDGTDWRAAMRTETWYRAQQAVDAGLADEVAGGGGSERAAARAIFNLSHFKNVPEWVRPLMAHATTTTQLSVGDRVRVRDGMEHDMMTRGAAGEIAEISTPALGIRFDAMPSMVHRWYTESEVEPDAVAGEESGDAPSPMTDNSEQYRYRAGLLRMEVDLVIAGGTR